MTKRSVVDVAGAVARGELSAAAVLEENLKAIAARESEYTRSTSSPPMRPANAPRRSMPT